MGFAISVCIIAKNEENNIGKCIDAIKPLVDYFEGSEIVLLDTGSEDNTVSIAKQRGVRVKYAEWKADFAAARNYAAELANNDFVLALDCDEFLINYSEPDVATLKKRVEANPGYVGMIERISVHEQDGEISKSKDRVGRLYDRKKYKYYGKIHENLCLIENPERVEGYFEIPLCFDHVGYDTPELRRKKAVRNRELLFDCLEDKPDDIYLMYQIGKCDVALNEYDEAITIYGNALDMVQDCSYAYIQNMIVSYGYCLIEKKEYQKALSLEKYADELQDNADYLFVMGLIHMNNAKFDRAISDFTCATNIDSCEVMGVNSYKAFYNIGVIYEVSNQKEKALSFYNRCGDYDKAKIRIASLNS